MKVEVCKADVPTHTRRIYPRWLLEREADRMQETIKARGWFGTLGPPDDSIIRLKDSSHLVTDLRMEGDNLVAEVEILNTPAGRVLKQLLEVPGLKMNFRLSGVGNGVVNEDGVLVVGESYKLIQIFAGDMNNCEDRLNSKEFNWQLLKDNLDSLSENK